MIELLLPLSPSVNSYYRSVVFGRSVRVLLSKEGRTYQVAAAEAIVSQRQGEAITTPIRVELDIYMARRGSDADNRAKACLDALQHAGVIKNDRQICDLHLRRYYDRKNPRIVVRIHEEAKPEMLDAA